MNAVARRNLSTWAEFVCLCVVELVPQTLHHFLTIRIFVVCPKMNIVLSWVSLPLLMLITLCFARVNGKAVMWTWKSFEERTKVISLAVNSVLLSPARLHHVLCLEHWLIWPEKAILNHFWWHKLVAAQLQNIYLSLEKVWNVNTSWSLAGKKKTRKMSGY